MTFNENAVKDLYKNVANHYKNRPPYDPCFFQKVLKKALPLFDLSEIKIADIGAGNGLSRQALVLSGCDPELISEVEPNKQMCIYSIKNGAKHIYPGTAVDTGLPDSQNHVVIFCNAIHQITKKGINDSDILSEIKRILHPQGKIIFVAQRFNPHDSVINKLNAACEQWKKEGLYPDYGANGIKFILNDTSDFENTKSILQGYPDLFMQPGYQEEYAAHQLDYDEEKFLGLMKSYLSFPVPASDKLISDIRDFFKAHSDPVTQSIKISCAQVAIIGKPLDLRPRCKL